MGTQNVKSSAVVWFMTTLVALATGCAAPGNSSASEEPTVIGEVHNGAGPGALAFPVTQDFTPTTGWIDPNKSFYVTTYGSSSCPNAPIRMEASQTALHVTMTRTGGPICTEDFGPTSYALDLPGSLQGLTHITITLEFDEDEKTDLILN